MTTPRSAARVGVSRYTAGLSIAATVAFMMSKFILSALLLLCTPALVVAQQTKPLPNPDLSGLSPADNAAVREARANFDKTSAGQSGIALAERYADLGAVYARAKLFDAAAVALDNAAQAAPLDGRWPYLQGVIARARAQPAVARSSFERAIKLNGGYLPARMALAGELLGNGELDKARTLLEQALVTQGDQPALRAMLGDIAFRQKRYPQAIEQLNEALRLDPQATSISAALARVNEAAGNSEAARAAQAKAGDVPPRLDDPLMQRILPVIESDPAQAGVSRDPVQLAIGEANFHASTGNFVAARAALDKAVRTSPNNALLLANSARVEIAAGNLEAARSRARAAVAADGKSAQALIIQGLVLEIANDDNGAADSFRRAIAADPKAMRARVGLGNIAMRAGKPADALAVYRAALATATDDVELWARVMAAQFVAGQCA
ncbi:MAG: tetratricopeptide repeat protein, partial [Dokdonella sp.]